MKKVQVAFVCACVLACGGALASADELDDLLSGGSDSSQSDATTSPAVSKLTSEYSAQSASPDSEPNSNISPSAHWRPQLPQMDEKPAVVRAAGAQSAAQATPSRSGGAAEINFVPE